MAKNPYNEWLKALRELDTFGAVSEEAYERNPQSAFGAFTSVWGGGQSDAFNDWLENQYSRTFGDFSARQLAHDPAASWLDYLEGVDPFSAFSFTAPYRRNERPSTFAPTMRMSR